MRLTTSRIVVAAAILFLLAIVLALVALGLGGEDTPSPDPDANRLSVTDGTCPPNQGRDACSVAFASTLSEERGTYWLHVRAGDGLEGWISSEFVTWASDLQ